MEEAIKVVIVDENAHEAERLLSAIKSTGVPLRSKLAQSNDELSEYLNESSLPHVILHSLDTKDIQLTDTVAAVNGHAVNIPIVALSEDNEFNPAEPMQNGAFAVVAKENTEHLQLVVNKIAETQLYIQSLQKKADAYEELDERFQFLLDASHDAISYVHEGLHIYANRAYLELFGIEDSEEAQAISVLELIAKDDQAKLKTLIKKIARDETVVSETLEFRLADDKYSAMDIELSPACYEGEACIQFLIRIESDQSKELQEQLSYLSERDLETGFLHRKSIIDKLGEALEAAKDGESKSAFLQLDIVNIDQIQEQHGLPAIDKVGGHIAELLRELCAETDLPSKLTEDSFGILTDTVEEDALGKLADTIKSKIESSDVRVDKKSVQIECCLGAVIIDDMIGDVLDILSSAKSACDKAWEQNDHKLVFHAPDLSDTSGTLLDKKWTTEVQDAIKENRLKLLYQPIVSLVGDPASRYQVYTQLVSKEGARVSIAQVLPSIERTGVSVVLDRWVINCALEQLSKLKETSPDAVFFIKLTTGTLTDDQLLPWLKEQFAAHKVDPKQLAFDVREETIVANLKDTRDLATGLSKLGCQIAIDAFGISKEPTKILSTIPAQYLKLSYQLMTNLTEQKDQVDQVRTICEQVKSKDGMVVAQFVESAEILSTIWSLGVDFATGDFFQKPAEEVNYDFSSMG